MIKGEKIMIDWTEEDIKFLCKNVMIPMGEEIAKIMEEHDKINTKSLEKVFDIIINQIKEIRYEQERDRRFYKTMFSEALIRNQLFTPAGYDAFYKSWCEEFDKLNKEKFK